MTKKDSILKEIEDIPNNLDEVLNFIKFVKYKHIRDKFEITSASESSLQKDWLNPEEEEAWRDL